MEVESRRRELEQKRHKRKMQLRRRLLAVSFVIGAAGLAGGLWALQKPGSDKPGNAGPSSAETGSAETGSAGLSGVELGSAETGSTELSSAELGDVGLGSAERTGWTEDAVQALLFEQTLPSRYDLREQGTAPTVPDQGTFGTCWAFASLGALESSMPEELRVRLSADHMSLQNSFGLGQDDGGDYSISTSYLLAWQGPVAEAEDPYGDGRSPEHLEPVCHVQEIQILREKDFEAIKRAVYENGGVQSSFYMPQTDGAERDRYYNEETYAFYYDGSLGANHDIVIVGWEDDFPKERFVKQPENDGAFLCMNTWGESFGDRGYFYISYEDSRIGLSNVSYTGIEHTDTYDTIFQTDLCGWTGQLGYGTSKAWFANVYTTETDCRIEASGFYATDGDASYRVYAVELTEEALWQNVTGVSGEGDTGAVGEAFSKRTLVADGQVDNAGFYTVPWMEALDLKAGDRFAVIVELESVETTEPVAVEYAAGLRTAKVDIGDGEGYISPDGVTWQRAETEMQCNICLKAYGKRLK